jgi:F-type H+-transporting ATPase subunit c
VKSLKKTAGLLLFLGVVFIGTSAYAAEGGEGGSDADATAMLAIGCVIGMGLAAHGCGIGMGNAASGAVNAMARNPGFYKNIFTNMIIGLALIEGLAIYTLVLALLFMLGNPLS